MGRSFFRSIAAQVDRDCLRALVTRLYPERDVIADLQVHEAGVGHGTGLKVAFLPIFGDNETCILLGQESRDLASDPGQIRGSVDPVVMLELLDLPLGGLERIPDADQDILMRMIVVSHVRDGDIFSTRRSEVDPDRRKAARIFVPARPLNQDGAGVQVRVEFFELADFFVDPLLQMPGWLDVSIRYLWFYFHPCTKAWLAGEQFDPCHSRNIFQEKWPRRFRATRAPPLVALIELNKAFPFSQPGIHLRLDPRP
jgi:hypothetical protein